jgi:hypothetical protein
MEDKKYGKHVIAIIIWAERTRRVSLATDPLAPRELLQAPAITTAPSSEREKQPQREPIYASDDDPAPMVQLLGRRG